MEGILKKVKESKLGEFLKSKVGKKIIGTILFSGLGIAIPRVFHVLVGSSAGATFLPMHFFVLIAALTLGGFSGSIVAGASVLGSYLLTGMPSVERLPYMLIELVLYAVILGICPKKWNTYVSLLVAMTLGRIVYAGVLWIAGTGLGISLNGISSVWQAVSTGIYGILLQLVFVPILVRQIKKGVKLDE